MYVILVGQALVFLLCVCVCVWGGGGAEPSLPEKKNELHLGAEHPSFIAV